MVVEVIEGEWERRWNLQRAGVLYMCWLVAALGDNQFYVAKIKKPRFNLIMEY